MRQELQLAQAKLGVLAQDAETLENLRQQLTREQEMRERAEGLARVCCR